jgi:hypothetical protein
MASNMAIMSSRWKLHLDPEDSHCARGQQLEPARVSGSLGMSSTGDGGSPGRAFHGLIDLHSGEFAADLLKSIR